MAFSKYKQTNGEHDARYLSCMDRERKLRPKTLHHPAIQFRISVHYLNSVQDNDINIYNGYLTM
ncbi:hypothetical protein OUZ56_022654 [Daphnia magna]|uniref:Uncharacterized protein n=1 Tax=Daphnia magna TaxID=35525 RepID=A0ABR0AXS4_9CRUS|nr:hypothetical protein OUZ56_022654 [Daphnia magna]